MKEIDGGSEGERRGVDAMMTGSNAVRVAVGVLYASVGLLALTLIGLSGALVRANLPQAERAGAGVLLTSAILAAVWSGVGLAGIAGVFAGYLVSAAVLGAGALMCILLAIAGTAGLAPAVGSKPVGEHNEGVHRAAIAIGACLAVHVGMWLVAGIFVAGVHFGVGTADAWVSTPIELIDRARAVDNDGHVIGHGHGAGKMFGGEQFVPGVHIQHHLPFAHRDADGRFMGRPAEKHERKSTASTMTREERSSHSSTYSEMRRGIFRSAA